MPPKIFLHTQLSGDPQKYFQLDPAHAKASLAHICIFTTKLFHGFAFNISRKSREIQYIKISGYYPVNQLAKLQIQMFLLSGF